MTPQVEIHLFVTFSRGSFSSSPWSGGWVLWRRPRPRPLFVCRTRGSTDSSFVWLAKIKEAGCVFFVSSTCFLLEHTMSVSLAPMTQLPARFLLYIHSVGLGGTFPGRPDPARSSYFLNLIFSTPSKKWAWKCISSTSSTTVVVQSTTDI